VRADSSIQWATYPALLVAGALSAGILLAEQGWLRPWGTWSAGAAVSILIYGLAVWDDRRRLVSLGVLGRLVAAALLAVSLGALRLVVFEAQPPDRLHRQAAGLMADGDTTTITGAIVNAPERTDERSRFTLRAETWHHPAGDRAATGKVRVTFRTSPWDDDPAPFPDVFEGDRISVHGHLRPPPAPTNPADFDYGAYLQRRGIHRLLTVQSAGDVRIRSRTRSRAQILVNRSRSHIRHLTQLHVPTPSSRAIIHALLLGDRSRVTDAHRDAFAQTGLMHLLAVSGLHVLLVGMVLYGLLRPMLHRFRLRWQHIEILRALLTVGILVLYMLLTGRPPSVVRAVVMASLFIGGIVLQRSSHTLNTLGVAAVILLMMRPTALFDVGFQLSLSAVAGIVVLNPRIEEVTRSMLPDDAASSGAGEWLLSMLTVSAAATLGTAPVLLHHFGFVAIGGLVLNVVAIPLTAVGLTASLLMGLAGAVWQAAGSAFGMAADVTIQMLILTARWGADWLGAGVRLPSPDVWLLAAIVCGTLAIAQLPRPRHRWRLVTITVIIIAAGQLVDAYDARLGPVLTVTFLDVGQGDAVLVETPDGRTMLIDGGPRSPYWDAGASIVVPHLKHRGIDRLDLVVATHPDSDHLGGLPAVFEAVSVGEFIHSGRVASTDLFAESREVLDRRLIPHRPVVTGDTLALGPHVAVEVLGPPPGRMSATWSENDASVVIALTYGATQILLPGDVEENGEQWLVQTFADKLDAHVVKVAHHGSATSSSLPFVRAAVPGSLPDALAVIPVGRRNRFGMPVPDVVTRWQNSGVNLLRTDLDGAIRVVSDGTAVSATTML